MYLGTDLIDDCYVDAWHILEPKRCAIESIDFLKLIQAVTWKFVIFIQNAVFPFSCCLFLKDYFEVNIF